MEDTAPAPDKSTLYQQLGGSDAIKAAVDIFYEKVIKDDRLKPFFDGVDMTRQHAHQRAFMTYAFGGAPNYQGRSLREAHKRLVEEKGLSDTHFNAVAAHLQETLEELAVPEKLIREVMAIVGSTQDDVLNR